MQTKVIRIPTGCGNTDSCRILLKKVNILPHVSQYKLSILMNFMVALCHNNIKHFIVQLMHSNYKILRLLK